MQCCLSEDKKTQRERNKKIEKIIKKDAKISSLTYRLLLLGTGESGKSTFIKQMHIIHGEGYTKEERKYFKKIIYQNVFTSMKSLIEAMKLLDIKYHYPGSMEFAQLIVDADYGNIECTVKILATNLKILWKDEGIQTCYRRRNEYQLNDSTEYFFTHIDRLADNDYLPTDADILRSRSATTGIVEFNIKYGTKQIVLIDVGGQKTERTKWIPMFDHLNAITFVVAISEYDQTLYEDQKTNRLEESLKLFTTIINYPYLMRKPIILFLNKTDLLDEKVKYSHLVDYFPEFQGPKMDPMSVREFILNKFVEQKEKNGGPMYNHYTCATNTDSVKNIFETVRSTIMKNYIDDNRL